MSGDCKCPACKGDGKLNVPAVTHSAPMVVTMFAMRIVCPICNGQGVVTIEVATRYEGLVRMKHAHDAAEGESHA